MILGVSFDPVEKNQAFAEKYSFAYPLLSDVSRAMGVEYGAADSPSAGTAKRIAYLVGADGKIEKSYGKVNPGNFPAEALGSLAE